MNEAYSKLDADKVIHTLVKLHKRITDRFAGSGLSKVCGALIILAKQTSQQAERIAKPNLFIRFAVVTFLMLGCAALVYSFKLIHLETQQAEVFDFVQGLEAAMNVVVLIGALTYFLVTFEERYKRRRVLGYLDELRSVVHVIDMHQLTKDPSAILSGVIRTKNSPKREMSEGELIRYLDYCSEMLSITSKLAALYTQNTQDPAVVRAVNDIERLTTNLSRKIWQKIVIVQSNSGPKVM
ncbi:MAG: hypothetical protein AAF228_02795 [Pseudomonadota bacterium]